MTIANADQIGLLVCYVIIDFVVINDNDNV